MNSVKKFEIKNDYTDQICKKEIQSNFHWNIPGKIYISTNLCFIMKLSYDKLKFHYNINMDS